MAAENSTPIPRTNIYLGAPLPKLISGGKEILAELFAEQARIYALAAAILHRAEPQSDDESPQDPAVWRLAEMLHDPCSDDSSLYTLEDCLEAIPQDWPSDLTDGK